MPSPQINEGMILGVLGVPLSVEAVAQLQTGAALSIIDGFDRQITRPNFIDTMNESLALYGAMGRLESVTTMLKMLKDNRLDAATLEKAVENLTNAAEHHRKELKDKMALVAQCPWDHDSKH